MPSYIKDPDSTKSYTIDWSAWLDGETISDSSWALDAGITNSSDTYDDTSTTILVAGGTIGTTYKAVNTITTSGGQVVDQTVYLTIEEK